MLIRFGDVYVNTAVIKRIRTVNLKNKSHYKVEYLDGSIDDLPADNDIDSQLSTIVPAQPGFVVLTVDDDGSVMESEVVAFTVDPDQTAGGAPKPITYDGMDVSILHENVGLRAPNGRVFSCETFFENQQQFLDSVAKRTN